MRSIKIATRTRRIELPQRDHQAEVEFRQPPCRGHRRDSDQLCVEKFRSTGFRKS